MMESVAFRSPMLKVELEEEEFDEDVIMDGRGDSMVHLTLDEAREEVIATDPIFPVCHAPFQPPPLFATVELNGVISMTLSKSLRLFISANEAVQLFNPVTDTHLTISGCGTHVAVVHPMGRLLQYNDKIEVQRRVGVGLKAAKIWSKGVSFTGRNCCLVYLVDEAGVRSSVEFFRDLYAANCACRTHIPTKEDLSIFVSSANQILSAANTAGCVDQSTKALENGAAWTDNQGLHWRFNRVTITQAYDGFVSVTKELEGKLFVMTLSPNNGKAKIVSPHVYMTASMGNNGHLFVRSDKKKLHLSNNAFVVRHGGSCAGFDENDKLRIW